MDSTLFDRVARSVTTAGSRRQTLRLAAGGLLGVLAGPGQGLTGLAGEAGAAACKRNRKRCRRNDQCCSGVCKKRKCRPAPQQGTCTIRQDTCKLTGGIGFGPKCNGVATCECIQTKTGAAFCRQISGAACTACGTDFDCVAALGPNAKCISGARCGDPCGIGDFCAVPCGFVQQ